MAWPRTARCTKRWMSASWVAISTAILVTLKPASATRTRCQSSPAMTSLNPPTRLMAASRRAPRSWSITRRRAPFESAGPAVVVRRCGIRARSGPTTMARAGSAAMACSAASSQPGSNVRSSRNWINRNSGRAASRARKPSLRAQAVENGRVERQREVGQRGRALEAAMRLEPLSMYTTGQPSAEDTQARQQALRPRCGR